MNSWFINTRNSLQQIKKGNSLMFGIARFFGLRDTMKGGWKRRRAGERWERGKLHIENLIQCLSIKI